MRSFITIWALIFVLSIPAWLTHVFSCFNHDQWGFLIAGAIFFPVAILHGWYIWIVSFFSLFGF